MAQKDKIAEIAERLAKLSDEQREAEIAKIDRSVAKVESKAQKDALSEHKEALGKAQVQTVELYCRENSLDIDTVLPITVKVKRTEDGKAIVGEVSGKGSRGGGGGGSRGKSFLAAAGVTAIELNGSPLAKCAESEVLRVAHGAKTGKDVYGQASPHQVALKPENQKLIREQGFVAVFEDGSRRPLIELYEPATAEA